MGGKGGTVMKQAREEWEEKLREELRVVKALAREEAKEVVENTQQKCLDVLLQS